MNNIDNTTSALPPTGNPSSDPLGRSQLQIWFEVSLAIVFSLVAFTGRWWRVSFINMHSEPGKLGNIWTRWLFVMHAYSEFHLRSHPPPPPPPNLTLAVFLTCIQGILYEQGTLGISFCCLPLIHVYNESSTSGVHSGSAFVVCL